MKFTNILRNIILEATKYETLLDALTKPTKDKEGKKQKPKLSKEVYNEIVKADPTTRLNDVDLDTEDKNELSKVKAGNYVQWLVKQYLSVPTETQPGESGYEREFKQNQSVFMEDLYKVTNDLMKFDRFKNRIPQENRDINKLNVKQLYELVKDFSLEKTKATKEEKKAASETYEHPGGQIVYRGNKWTVAKISDTGKLGKDAACWYGGYYLETTMGETRWCTSAPGLNWFDRYIKDGPLYVVIPNKYEGRRGEKTGLPSERYQFHFQSNQFMDVHDHGIDLIKMLNGPMSELKDFFKPEFARNLTVGGDVLQIDSFSSGPVGKYIGLYGFDDIFDYLPESLVDLQIANKENNGIIIKVPEEIGRLKNLEFMLFENCVDHLPDSICQLNNLRFISLHNNTNLKTIPACVAKLPNLAFINLKGSDNCVVPQEIEQVATKVGKGMYDLGE